MGLSATRAGARTYGCVDGIRDVALFPTAGSFRLGVGDDALSPPSIFRLDFISIARPYCAVIVMGLFDNQSVRDARTARALDGIGFLRGNRSELDETERSAGRGVGQVLRGD